MGLRLRTALGLGLVIALMLAPAVPASVAPTSISRNVQVNDRAPDQLIEDFKAPSVAINPRDPRQVVVAYRHDVPDFNCHIAYSTDGGASFADSSFPAPPKGTCWAPTAAFDDRNHVYVAAQNRPPAGGSDFSQNIIVWKSSDGGRSFAAPVTVPGSDGPDSFSVQAGLAVDTSRSSPHYGRIYVTWHAFPNFPTSLDAYLSFSSDGAASWSPPATRPVAGQWQDFPHPAVAQDGTVYVVFRDTFTDTTTNAGCPGIGGNFFGILSAPADCEIRVLRSSNGGASFDGDPFLVATAHYAANNTARAEEPGIAVSPSGTVLVTFASQDQTPSATCTPTLDTLVARSTNRAVSWGAPVQVKDDGCASGEQRDPWLGVAPNGRVDAIFYDNRGTGNQALYNVRYANSTDDARTFGPTARVNDATFDGAALFDPKVAGFQSTEFDVQNGIGSTNSSAVGAWGDTRNQAPQTGGASDVFSVRIGLTRPAVAPRPGGAYSQPSAPFADCPTSTANVIRGSAASDSINGTPRADRIFAGTGNDTVDGLAGDDCIDLGPGTDPGQGGDGRDLILGGLGEDRLAGNLGEDRLLGGASADRLIGGFGDDRLHGQSGSDRINGERGRDRINGGSAGDRISGGSSGDRIAGDQGNDRITGNSGNDSIKGNSGKDRLTGGSGKDRISGGSGGDRVNARDNQRDRVNCGSGRDRVVADRIDVVSGNCERVRRR